MSNKDKYVFVYYKDYAHTVTTNFQTFLENDLYIDLIFVCQNNKKVGAHQVVLGCLSKFFYSIFDDNVNTTKEKVLHIYVPDIRAKIMRYILEFIYSGKATLNKDELEEFNEDIKLLGMPLDHFSAPSEATENNAPPAVEKPLRKPASRVPHVISDTVDLTDTSTNDNVESVNGSSNNINQSSSRETPAEASTSAALSTASDTHTNDTPTPPIVDKNPTDKNPIARSSETENRTTSTSSSSSSDATKSKLKISERENRTASTSLSSKSDVAMGRKSSNSENRTPSTSLSSSSTTTKVSENKINVVKAETVVHKAPENCVKNLPNGDIARKRTKNVLPPPTISKRGKYLAASIDLSDDEDDDVITLS